MRLSKRHLNKLINQVLNEGKSELTILLEVELFNSDTGEIDGDALESLMKKASEGDRDAAVQLRDASGLIVQKTGDKFNAFDGVKLDRESITKAYGLDKPPPRPKANTSEKPKIQAKSQKSSESTIDDGPYTQERFESDLRKASASGDTEAIAKAGRLRQAQIQKDGTKDLNKKFGEIESRFGQRLKDDKERALQKAKESMDRYKLRTNERYNEYIEDIKTADYYRDESERKSDIAKYEEKKKDAIEEIEERYKEEIEDINRLFDAASKKSGASAEKTNASNDLQEGLSRGSLYRRRYYGRY